MKYQVIFTETVARSYVVEAENEEDAEELGRRAYDNGEEGRAEVVDRHDAIDVFPLT